MKGLSRCQNLRRERHRITATFVQPVVTDPDPKTDDDDAREGDVTEEEASTPRQRVRWGRVLLWVLLVVFVVAAAGAGAVFWVVRTLPERVAATVREKAAERGFQVEFSSVRAIAVLPWEKGEPSVRLEGVRLTSTQVEDVTLDVDSLRVPLTGTFPAYEPEHVYADGVKLHAKNFATLIAFERVAKSPEASKTPVDITDVSIRLRTVSEAVPLGVVAEVARVEVRPGSVDFEDVRLEVPVPFVDLSLGPASAAVRRGEGKTTVQLEGYPYATATLDDAGEVLGLEVTPIESAVVERLLRTDLPDMMVSGSVTAKIGGKGARSGTFSVLLDGYGPPVPKEAQGIVFGKKTKLTGAVRVDGSIIYLNDLVVEVGSFKMTGHGVVNVLKGTLEIRLKGSVPCSEMAASAAGAHFGREAAILTRALSSGHLGGSIAISVNVDGSLSDIKNVKIVPSAALGCRISI